MNVFFDTNVLMDVLLSRRPFVEDAQKTWFLAERSKIRGLVSVLSYPNIYYIVRKIRDADAATAMMTMLRGTFMPVSFDEQILNQAMDAGFSDFEDAIQYYSALRAEAACLLTRNANDFPASPALPVLAPGEFLAAHAFD